MRYGFAFAVAVSVAIAVWVAGEIPGDPLRVGEIIVAGEMVGGNCVGSPEVLPSVLRHLGMFFSAVYAGRGDPSLFSTAQGYFSSLGCVIVAKFRFHTNITPIHG